MPRKRREHTQFCLHFRPGALNRSRSINVLPDFLGPDAIEVHRVEIDGVDRAIADPRSFQISLQPEDLGRHVVVHFRQSKATYDRLSPYAIEDDRLPERVAVASKP